MSRNRDRCHFLNCKIKHIVDFDLEAKPYLHVHIVVVTAVYPDIHCPVVQFPSSVEVKQEGPQALSRIYV